MSRIGLIVLGMIIAVGLSGCVYDEGTAYGAYYSSPAGYYYYYPVYYNYDYVGYYPVHHYPPNHYYYYNAPNGPYRVLHTGYDGGTWYYGGHRHH